MHTHTHVHTHTHTQSEREWERGHNMWSALPLFLSSWHVIEKHIEVSFLHFPMISVLVKRTRPNISLLSSFFSAYDFQRFPLSAHLGKLTRIRPISTDFIFASKTCINKWVPNIQKPETSGGSIYLCIYFISIEYKHFGAIQTTFLKRLRMTTTHTDIHWSCCHWAQGTHTHNILQYQRYTHWM